MQIGWIDFSRDERNRIMKTLSLLDTSDTVDELGIGTIRDAYSDILFPGISTLQSRAKYFVLIPYIFDLAEKQSFDSPDKVLPWVEEQERALVSVLLRNSKDTDVSGIHGSHSKNHDVQYKPSAIYWGGLRTFGIVRFPTISFSAACRIVYEKSRQKPNRPPLQKEDIGFDDPTAYTDNDLLFTPFTADERFPGEAAIGLTRREAHFLRRQITTARAVRGSLLEYMLDKKITWPSFDKIPAQELPRDLALSVSLAQQFSEFIHGAHLRYNVQYLDESGEEYAKRYAKWAKDFAFKKLNLKAILAKVPRNAPKTELFLDAFAEAAASGNTRTVDRLIVEQEKHVKSPGRAKLGKPTENPDAAPVHEHKLVYRYNTAHRLVREILDALQGGKQ